MPLFLGIDISTTGSKAIIMTEDGAVLQSSTHAYPLSTPKPLWSEQDPDDWWDATRLSVRESITASAISPGDIAGVGLTGQMHGLVLLDKNFQILRPAILWNDQRTDEQCREMAAKIGMDQLVAITGNPALTGFTAPKLLWVRQHEPQVYARIAHVLLPKDFIRYKLTSELAIDCADASGTSLLDLNTRNWSDTILDLLDIPSSWLPHVYEGTAITGVVSSQAETQTGIPAGTPVVGGAGDQAASAVGVGAVTEGILALTLGTSGVVFAPTDSPRIDPQGRLHAMCHGIPPAPGQGWHLMGVMLSAAGSLRWYRDNFASNHDYAQLVESAASIEPGSEGLIFLPYLSGERTPYPDPLARGGFVGLTVRHTPPHLVRALLEGVAFGLKDSFRLIQNAGGSQINQVRITGGGAQSALWRQILADVLDYELVTVNSTEGAALGAAILAGVGTSHWRSTPEACQSIIQPMTQTKPHQENVKRYTEAYAIYHSLYPTLTDTFHSLSTFSTT